MREHTKDCRWEKSSCEYKATHYYCPHEKHACDCTTPIDTDPLEAILHKHITYGEGFDAYIVDDVDAFREDLERLVLQAKIDSLSRVVLEYGNRRATIWLGTGKYADLQDYIAQLTKELEQLNGDKDDMWLLREQ